MVRTNANVKMKLALIAACSVLTVSTAVAAVEDTAWGHIKELFGLPVTTESDVAAKRGGKTKVALCPWDADEEVFKRITVAEPAVSAHVSHGDEIPGGDLLDANCKSGEITVELPGGAAMEFV